MGMHFVLPALAVLLIAAIQSESEGTECGDVQVGDNNKKDRG